MRFNVLEKDENGNDIVVNTIEAASAESVPWLRVVPVIEDFFNMMEKFANTHLDSEARSIGYDDMTTMRLAVETDAWHEDGVLGNTLYENVWKYVFEVQERMKDNPENALQELDAFYAYCGEHFTLEEMRKD